MKKKQQLNRQQVLAVIACIVATSEIVTLMLPANFVRIILSSVLALLARTPSLVNPSYLAMRVFRPSHILSVEFVPAPLLG